MRPSIVLLIAVFAALCGCDEPVRYRAIAAPKPEVPSVNIPFAARQKNWVSREGEGSCVHASLSSMLHWQNQFQLAKWWRSQYSGGEWSDQLRRRLESAKIPFAYTERANLQLLDDAHASRRGALLWWKPSHCCTFVGWSKGNDGRVFAVILDNNKTDSFEMVERSQFHKLWAGYGGFALMTLFDPPSPPVWQSYEPIQETWQW